MLTLLTILMLAILAFPATMNAAVNVSSLTTPTERIYLNAGVVDVEVNSTTYYSSRNSSSITVTSLACFATQYGNGILPGALMTAESYNGANYKRKSISQRLWPNLPERFEVNWVNETGGNNTYSIGSADQPAYTYAGVNYDGGYVGWDFYWMPVGADFHFGY